TGARWDPVDAPPERTREFTDQGLHPVVATCLAGRPGLGGPDFTPSFDHLLDPYLMLGMDHAVQRLREAAQKQHKVRIITDYDVDGTTSSLILQAALKIIGLNDVSYHIPNRFNEGYGFSVQAAQIAADDGVDLIVTADIGVRDHAAVQRAHENGVEVLICDHHLPAGADVPQNALVLCPPQKDCTYPNPHLAACGVSFKVAQALLADHPNARAILSSILKLAAIGTIADLVPLTHTENRAIVAIGLHQLNHSRHSPGLAALIQVAGLTDSEITERDLGFRIGPRINAAGRVSSANLVVQLLTCRDTVQARALARQLDELNGHRRQLQRRLVSEVLSTLDEQSDPFVVVAGPEADGWHRGVVGIVASRIKDEVHRPVAVISVQGDTAVGSVRSVPAVHAVKALDSVSDLLVRYGGHPAAAGFTVPTADIDKLRERLGTYVQNTAPEEQLVPVRQIDATADISRLDFDLLTALRKLGPFGMGNPEPRLLLRGVRASRTELRADGRLLVLRLNDQRGGSVDAIWWGKGELKSQLESATLDLLVTMGTNTYRGRTSLQLQLIDARVSAES
ncbi:MAG: single-stranded-DNA-specific exonuclease, partial [Kiritimatiellia bacterium]